MSVSKSHQPYFPGPVIAPQKEKHIMTVLCDEYNTDQNALEKALTEDFKDLKYDKPEYLAKITLKYSISKLQVPIDDRKLGPTLRGVLSLISAFPRTQKLLGAQSWIYPQPRTDAPDKQHTEDYIFKNLLQGGGEFKPNARRYNSILYYIPALIYHDLFKFDQLGLTISPPLLDLAFLYGYTPEDQKAIRTFENGFLKRDAFADIRFVVRPKAIAVLAVVLSRNHNFIAQELKNKNEGNQFSRLSKQERDEKLFQTARMINRGCYWSIITDFINKILGIKDGDYSPIPAEYSFPFISFSNFLSQTDTAYTNAVLHEYDTNKKFQARGLWSQYVLLGLTNVEKGKLKRGTPIRGLSRKKKGNFDTSDLREIMKIALNEVSGQGGASNIPEGLKTLEVNLMKQSVHTHTGFNEFRKRLGLNSVTFSEFDQGDKLKQIYGTNEGDIDLFVGLITEKQQPTNFPIPYTAGYGMMFTIFNAVHRDDFFAHQFNPQHLTNWGYKYAHGEVGEKKENVLALLIEKFLELSTPTQRFYMAIESVHAVADYTQIGSVWTNQYCTTMYSMNPVTTPTTTIPVMKPTSGESSTYNADVSLLSSVLQAQTTYSDPLYWTWDFSWPGPSPEDLSDTLISTFLESYLGFDFFFIPVTTFMSWCYDIFDVLVGGPLPPGYLVIPESITDMMTYGTIPSDTVFGRLISNESTDTWITANMAMLAIMAIYPLRNAIINVSFYFYQNGFEGFSGDPLQVAEAIMINPVLINSGPMPICRLMTANHYGFATGDTVYLLVYEAMWKNITGSYTPPTEPGVRSADYYLQFGADYPRRDISLNLITGALTALYFVVEGGPPDEAAANNNKHRTKQNKCPYKHA